MAAVGRKRLDLTVSDVGDNAVAFGIDANPIGCSTQVTPEGRFPMAMILAQRPLPSAV